MLDKEIQYIKGVGPERARLLEKLGVKTVFDLLYYFPRTWVDRSNVKKISSVTTGELETVSGTVIAADSKQLRPRLKITNITIKDETGFITGVWFNQPYIEKIFKKGMQVIFHGRVEAYRSMLQIGTPEYEITDDGTDPDESVNVNRIVPVYPLTDGLSQKQFRKIIKFAIDNHLKSLEEYMPEAIAKKYSLIKLNDAVYNVHYPESFDLLEKSKRRLIFDEFFFLQFAFAMRKSRIKEEPGIILKPGGPLFSGFIKNLPFTLTGAQKKVLDEIQTDFSSGKPMNRLVQGDVGSGKTIVALAACVMAAENGYQSAIMAPTEILAVQHAANMQKVLEGTGIKAELLLGGIKKSNRDDIIEALKDGKIQILVGTHALIQDDVVFKKLGLVVIDEQHRFGVMQRAALLKKSETLPHSLIMTATPIPRTLTLSVYGDTDISVIDELPPGRKPVKTMIFESAEVFKMFSFIEERLKEKARVYAVYPLVDESEKLDLKSAIEMEKEWSKRFKDYKISLIHGQMKKEERDEAMKSFKDGSIDILVATTVIEVGVDVPEASVIVIEHAERFGLSQLHQLRGRVGRGSAQSYCVLVGDARTEDSFKRLGIMAATQDGFKISEADLEIRGPGEFMGTRQHGVTEFKIASIIRDKKELDEARQAAFSVISGECDLNHSEKEQLVRIIKQKYGSSFDLINIG